MSNTIQQWAQNVLGLQSSMRLDHVVYYFNCFMSDLKELYPSKPTEWYNHHPISLLFADKISSLSGAHFTKSFVQCQALAKGETIDY